LRSLEPLRLKEGHEEIGCQPDDKQGRNDLFKTHDRSSSAPHRRMSIADSTNKTAKTEMQIASIWSSPNDDVRFSRYLYQEYGVEGIKPPLIRACRASRKYQERGVIAARTWTVMSVRVERHDK
jgi:hypothetical protein